MTTGTNATTATSLDDANLQKLRTYRWVLSREQDTLISAIIVKARDAAKGQTSLKRIAHTAHGDGDTMAIVSTAASSSSGKAPMLSSYCKPTTTATTTSSLSIATAKKKKTVVDANADVEKLNSYMFVGRSKR